MGQLCPVRVNLVIGPRSRAPFTVCPKKTWTFLRFHCLYFTWDVRDLIENLSARVSVWLWFTVIERRGLVPTCPYISISDFLFPSFRSTVPFLLPRIWLGKASDSLSAHIGTGGNSHQIVTRCQIWAQEVCVCLRSNDQYQNWTLELDQSDCIRNPVTWIGDQLGFADSCNQFSCLQSQEVPFVSTIEKV